MKKKRKYLIGLLCAMLVLCMLPVNAFAASKPTPGKVGLTKISASAYNKITVNWKKTSNTTSYMVYYKKYGTSKWTKLASVSPSKTSYTHTASKKYPIVVGQKYSYTVKAYNKTSKKYGAYNTKGLTTRTIPNTVKLNKTSLNANKTAVTVSWNKTAGCNYYLVYRKTGSSGWKKLTSVKSNVLKYTDKNPVKGTKNTYTVKAYYSKTKASGKYNSKGLTVSVPKETSVNPTPDNPTPTPPKHIPVYNVVLDKEDILMNIEDGSFKLTATIIPENATCQTVTWSSTNPSVATVDSNGRVTPLSNGATWIEASAEDEVGGCFVTVIDKNAIAMKVVELTNQERVKAGRPPLQTHPNLQKAAMFRASELEISFSHTRPDGSNSGTAVSAMGVANNSDENISRGRRTPEDVVQAWMNSSGHRAAIMRSTNKYIGVGFHYDQNGTYYWTQEFTDGDPDEKCTLTLDTQGGSYIEPVIAPRDATVYMKDIPMPTKDGYTFTGWYSSTDATRYPIPLNSVGLNKNCTIYARWE